MDGDDLKNCEYLLTLPNKTHISYAFPQDLKKAGGQFQWFRSFYDYRIVNRIPKKKKSSPRLGLWSPRGNQKIICGDFDELPSDYDSWDTFHLDMKKRYSSKGYVFRSVSGKVKVFFLVELKTNFINHKMGKYILSKLLEKNHFSQVDTSYTGMSICYTNPIMIAGFRKWLESSPEPQKVNLAPVFRKIANHNFDIHKGKLPKILEMKFIKGNKAKELLCRILLRQRRMAMKSGFDIPTTKFSRELGVDQKTVHRWRNELVELNFITCIDETYKINKKGMTYKALGLFKKITIQIFKTIKDKTKKFHALPTTIADGMWHSTIWNYSKYYFKDRQDEFIEWVASLPDSDKHGRMKKAYNALKSRLIYNDMEYLHLVK